MTWHTGNKILLWQHLTTMVIDKIRKMSVKGVTLKSEIFFFNISWRFGGKTLGGGLIPPAPPGSGLRCSGFWTQLPPKIGSLVETFLSGPSFKFKRQWNFDKRLRFRNLASQCSPVTVFLIPDISNLNPNLLFCLKRAVRTSWALERKVRLMKHTMHSNKIWCFWVNFCLR